MGYVNPTCSWPRWKFMDDRAQSCFVSVRNSCCSHSMEWNVGLAAFVVWCNAQHLPYILESNPHPFYSFRGLKYQMRIRIACGLDSRSWAGFSKNDRASVRAARTIQYNNLLFYLLFIILYNICILLFIRLAVITQSRTYLLHGAESFLRS